MACAFPHEVAHDVCPSAVLDKTLQAYLTEAFAAVLPNFSVPPIRLLLCKIPVYGPNDLDLKWMPDKRSGWDADLDLSLLMAPEVNEELSAAAIGEAARRRHLGKTRYRAKAAIFHVHQLLHLSL